MAEFSVTLKGGPGYEAPWIVARFESVEEMDRELDRLEQAGAFEAIQTLAHQFRNAPVVTSEQAVANVQAAIPGSQVVGEEDRPPWEEGRPTPATASTAPGATSQPAPAASVAQSTPPCETCGGATTFRSGNHPSNGPWEAYFCDSGDRAHTRFLGR